uniref:Uncharacterized protein n=1 Tax=Peronospora matthiolae TaxID=2874970 RepID=A0AAV1UBV1_9STRA
MNLRVMGTKERDGGAARGAIPAAVVHIQKKTIEHQLEEKLAVPAAAAPGQDDRHARNLSERMCMMESLDLEQVDRQRNDSLESSVFGAALKAGQGITSWLWSVLLLPSGHRLSLRPSTLVPDDQLLLEP